MTRFQYRLHEVPSFVGGMLVLPATAETIAGFIAAAEAAPEELSTIANVMPCPPMPFVPEEQHGKLVILALMACAGDDRAPASAPLAPFRALATPLADMVKPMPYPEIYPPEDDELPPAGDRAGRCSSTGSTWPVAETIVEHLEASDAAMRVAQLRVLGGAMARVPADATAFAHRGSPDHGQRRRVLRGSRRQGPSARPGSTGFAAALHQGDHGAYVNFLGDEGEERVRAAYPGATWDRLADDQGSLRPDEPLPAQPEHPAGGRARGAGR